MIRTINLFTKAVLDTPTSWLDKFSSVWLVGDYYYSSIDGVSYLDGELDPITSQTIDAHSLPADGQIRGRLLTTMGLG